MLAKLRHLFTPHHTNNHKARTIHPHAFVFYILLIFLVQVSFKVVKDTFPEVLGYATDISTDALISLTNQKRAEAGLAPLNISPTLSAAAAGKAQDMFSKGYWAHIAPDGKTPWDFIKGAGYSYSHAGENLAKDFNDSGSVVNAWMDSPSHRENMLKNDYQEIGFAVVNGNLNGHETTLVVQMFGTPVGGTTVAQTNIVQAAVPPSPTIAFLSPTPIKQVIPSIEPEITPESLITPTTEPTIVPVAKVEDVTPPQLRVAGATLPAINIMTASKTVALAMIGFLLFVLALDSILIWKHKTVRIAGHNFAHMLFLVALIGVIYFTGTGIIL